MVVVLPIVLHTTVVTVSNGKTVTESVSLSVVGELPFRRMLG